MFILQKELANAAYDITYTPYMSYDVVAFGETNTFCYKSPDDKIEDSPFFFMKNQKILCLNKIPEDYVSASIESLQNKAQPWKPGKFLKKFTGRTEDFTTLAESLIQRVSIMACDTSVVKVTDDPTIAYNHPDSDVTSCMQNAVKGTFDIYEALGVQVAYVETQGVLQSRALVWHNMELEDGRIVTVVEKPYYSGGRHPDLIRKWAKEQGYYWRSNGIHLYSPDDELIESAQRIKVPKSLEVRKLPYFDYMYYWDGKYLHSGFEHAENTDMYYNGEDRPLCSHSSCRECRIDTYWKDLNIHEFSMASKTYKILMCTECIDSFKEHAYTCTHCAGEGIPKGYMEIDQGKYYCGECFWDLRRRCSGCGTGFIGDSCPSCA